MLGALSLARQRPRAAQRRRAHGDPHARRANPADSIPWRSGAAGAAVRADRTAGRARHGRAGSDRRALDETDWNVAAAARLLGTERTSLHKRIRALGLKMKRISAFELAPSSMTVQALGLGSRPALHAAWRSLMSAKMSAWRALRSVFSPGSIDKSKSDSTPESSQVLPLAVSRRVAGVPCARRASGRRARVPQRITGRRSSPSSG